MTNRRLPYVVYWAKQPTPYFVKRFNAVARRGTLQFEVWFQARREFDRSWDVEEKDWEFPARYVQSESIFGFSMPVPVAEIALYTPDLLVQEYDRAPLVVGFLVAHAFAGRTAFRVLPNYDSWSDRTWWRELAKRFIFSMVDAAKVPGPAGRELATKNGLSPARIFEVTQSIDLNLFRRAQSIDPEQRHTMRESLGLRGCVFIYVGRIWQGKGLDYLFKAYELIQREGLDATLLLVGDGVDEPHYREMSAHIKNVIWAGFVQPRDLPDYYGLADVSVFPTLGDPNGLVVEEAMASGLPVLSSSAAGDIGQRLPDGQAGFVVPVGDTEALAAKMMVVAKDLDLSRRMGRMAASLVEGHDDDRYAQDFEAFVRGTLALDRTTGLLPAVAKLMGNAISFAQLRSVHPAPLVSVPEPRTRRTQEHS
jgi:glycosyltransferase involved in cell wall biosynthesis